MCPGADIAQRQLLPARIDAEEPPHWAVISRRGAIVEGDHAAERYMMTGEPDPPGRVRLSIR